MQATPGTPLANFCRRSDALESPCSTFAHRWRLLWPWRKSANAQRHLFVALALFIVAADAATKVWVVSALMNRPPVKLLGGWVYLTQLRNTGAAFNIGDGFTILLSVIAMAVVIYMVWLSRRLASMAWAVALGLIAGGATGNLIDRLLRAPGPLRGGVVDFISIADPASPPWPVFNVADSALVIGVAVVVTLELFRRKPGFRPWRSGAAASSGDSG